MPGCAKSKIDLTLQNFNPKWLPLVMYSWFIKGESVKDIAQKYIGPIFLLRIWLILLVDVHLAFNGASSD